MSGRKDFVEEGQLYNLPPGFKVVEYFAGGHRKSAGWKLTQGGVVLSYHGDNWPTLEMAIEQAWLLSQADH